MPLTGAIPGVKAHLLTADDNVSIDTTEVQIDSYTPPQAGTYAIFASITFDNTRSNTSSTRYVVLYLSVGTTFAARVNKAQNVGTLVHVTTGAEYVTISLTWAGEVASGENIYLSALVHAANIVATDAALNRSQWLVLQLPAGTF